jgi:DNA-binding GntR family transcriptional regulator
MSSPADSGRAVPNTTAQHALTHLREAIVSGALVPGERIGQENVAGRLGISLAPVREALRILEREGQVTYRPRRGYIVTELNIVDLEEIYSLRALLEREAAYAALPALTSDDLAAIEQAAANCAAATSSPSSPPTAASTTPSSPRPDAPTPSA